MMTEAALRQAIANARDDLEAVPVRKALLERRAAMLLTETVDEIIAVDHEVRAHCVLNPCRSRR
jgi:hypothetical protein